MKSSDYPVIVLGHRGYRKLYPENTLLAFKKAVEFGADGIELDVRKAKDGSIVVIHDPDCERVSGLRGVIKELSYKEIRKLRLPMNQYIPTLDMVYAELGEDVFINVEIKDIEAVETSLQIVRSFNAVDRTLFSSFIPQALYKLRELQSDAYLGLLVDTKDQLSDISKVNERVGLYSLNAPLDGIKFLGIEAFKNLIAKVKEEDIKVALWHFDEAEWVEKIKGYYDCIITDDVQAIVSKLEELY